MPSRTAAARLIPESRDASTAGVIACPSITGRRSTLPTTATGSDIALGGVFDCGTLRSTTDLESITLKAGRRRAANSTSTSSPRSTTAAPAA